MSLPSPEGQLRQVGGGGTPFWRRRRRCRSLREINGGEEEG